MIEVIDPTKDELVLTQRWGAVGVNFLSDDLVSSAFEDKDGVFHVGVWRLRVSHLNSGGR
jgi:hypothetical protein